MAPAKRIEKVAKHSFEIDEDLLREVMVEIARRDILIKQATWEAWNAWLKKPAKSSKYKAKHTRLHDDLEKILNKGNADVVKSMKWLISHFSMLYSGG